MLHTEPSFCIYADGKRDLEIRSSKEKDGCEFTFSESTILIAEDDESSRFKNLRNEENSKEDNKQTEIMEPPSPKMHLATGFGINVMLGVECKLTAFDEAYYKLMVIQDPCNPLFLRNYAQLLQSKGDLTGAEDYYLHATILDPKDGEVLMEYAKLLWELHRDQERASSYFEKAANAAPEDCNILAAYASFLWRTDQVDDREDYWSGNVEY